MEFSTKQVPKMTTSFSLEPPAFVSSTKKFAEYKKDLLRWSRLSSVKPELQAELVIYKLEGDPSNIKEKIVTKLGDELEDNPDGINLLLDFLETVYGEDDMAEAYDRYVEFKNKKRKHGESIQTFTSDWESLYQKCENVGCELPDMVLCFELLQAAQLEATEAQLVLTGVDYKKGRSKGKLLEQMKTSLKKFKGRAVIGGGGKSSSELTIKTEDTYISKDVETYLVKKGWTKPKKRRRSNSEPAKEGGGYLGRKNMLDNKGVPLKCHLCRCKHEANCTCPCVYHFANKCPSKAKVQNNESENKRTDALSELGLFMAVTSAQTNDSCPSFAPDIGSIPPSTPPADRAEESQCSRGQEDVAQEEEICLLTQNMNELILATRVEDLRALLDCACPSTVTGLAWMKKMISELSVEQKKKVIIEPSSRVYKFGGGERRASKYAVKFPCNLAGKNCSIRTEVIDENLPLLLGNSSLKAAKAVLFIAEQKAVILGREVEMREESSGHFSMEISSPKTQDSTVPDETDICFMIQNEDLNEKSVWKLHQYWGHKPAECLLRIIKDAGKLTPEVEGYVLKLKDCKSCKLTDKRRPRPKVAFPRATRPNQVVTMDLKSYGTGKHSYILHMVDMFSRLHMAEFIPNKEAETVAEAVLKIWISQPGLGPMEFLHSDRGGEFLNETLTKVAEYLQVKHTATASYTPNANGLNERNHYTVDTMLERMILAEPDLKVEVALSWCINAKNTLGNHNGFSPAQIVFGQNPKLPTIFTAGPPGLEDDISMPKAVAQHINSIHLAREAFIKCESDRTLKAALRQRLYKTAGQIYPGDWVYFKNHRKWEGPVKVTTMEGKRLYAVRANKLLTINIDNVVLAEEEDYQMINQNTDVEEVEEEGDAAGGAKGVVVATGATFVPDGSSPSSAPATIGSPSLVPDSGSSPSSAPDSGSSPSSAPDGGAISSFSPAREPVPVLGSDEEVSPLVSPPDIPNESGTDENERVEEMEIDGQLVPAQGQTFWSRPISANDVRKMDIVRFKRSSDDDWMTGEVSSRAGKATGMYSNFWNIKNIQTGHQQPEDVAKFTALEKITIEENAADSGDIATYAVNIPFWRFHEKECVRAKEVELEKFDEFDVYEEVPENGQKVLGCRWVLTEKFKDGMKCVKARLCIRGDLEDTSDIRTDSPTVRKGNINILLVVAATEGWTITTSDVTAAFLQSGQIERDIFVRPPPERKVPGMIWKLKRTVYGVKDASRGFYLNFSGKLQDFGCEKSLLDPAMFLYFKEGVNRDDFEKHPLGMAVTHVDDVLHTGDEQFDAEIMNPIKEAFKFGTEEDCEFRYCGLNMKQTKSAIEVDQNHYVANLQEPEMDKLGNINNNEVLNEVGQTEFRSSVAKLSTIAYTSRPDLCFEVKSLSSKYGKAKKSDLRAVKRKIALLKSEEDSEMRYPNMGEVNEWVLVGFGDAGIKSMPDKMTSISGQVILLCNKVTGATAVLNWRSKKLRRKVTSSLAGECYAMIAVIGELVYTKAVLSQIYGQRMKDIPTIVVTDCKNLEEAVHSSSLVEDRWLITDVAAIKEALERKEITEIQRVPSERMIANCLTKAGASGKELLTILRTGKFHIPEGWLNTKKS